MLKDIVNRRIFLLMLSLVSVVFFLCTCIRQDAKKRLQPGTSYEQYAGSATCKNCHQPIYEDHLQTFHHQTSASASSKNIKGSTLPGKNRFYFQPDLFIAVEKKGDSLFQTAYQQGVEKISRPFDFVIGSGKRGQTFLYWYNKNIFQLPLTYFTATDEWTNSPGYSNKVQFNRPITSRCLECHTTYMQDESSPEAKAEEFSKSEIILGIECEKCHGPAAEHVAFHEKNPQERSGHFIVNPARLSRTQNLDLCRLCHGGRLTKSQPSFSFVAGNRLSDYFVIDTTQKNIADVDVHGNQYGMLSASKCFTSGTMTCTSCHAAHRNEKGQKEVFAARCMTCHSAPDHKACKLSGEKEQSFLTQYCTDCHMPELPSKTIMVLRQGETVPSSAFMRSHYISIYKEEIKKILKDHKGEK